MVSNPSECTLCLETRDLCHSHVIPEWLYEPLYDEIHRYHVLPAARGAGTAFGQKGLRERLLCQPCETAFSRYEGYARGVLVGGAEIEILNLRGGIEIRGLDYAKFKLFQLSVLWRAGVAQQSFFSEVDLGGHSDQLRKMLRTQDPGGVSDFGCIMVPIIVDDQLLTDLITQPVSLTLSGNPLVRLVFGGHAWLYVVGTSDSHPFANLFLRQDGTLQIRGAGRSVRRFLGKLAGSIVRSDEEAT